MVETLHEQKQDVQVLRRDVAAIKRLILEDLDLSDEAEAALQAARAAPESEYVDI